MSLQIRLVSIVLFCSFLSLAQSKRGWRTINQSHYGMKYELPKEWAIDEFGSSSVCHCAGSINIGQRFDVDEIYMVAYPAREEEDLFTGMRTEVWNWKFEEKEERILYQTDQLKFYQTISRWAPESTKDEDERAMVVWRFVTSFEGQHYVLYFWAKDKPMKKHKTLIYMILDRFKAVKSSAEDVKYW